MVALKGQVRIGLNYDLALHEYKKKILYIVHKLSLV